MKEYVFNINEEILTKVNNLITEKVRNIFKDKDKSNFLFLDETNNLKYSFNKKENLIKHLEENISEHFNNQILKNYSKNDVINIYFYEMNDVVYRSFLEKYSGLNIFINRRQNMKSCTVYDSKKLQVYNIDYKKQIDIFKEDLEKTNFSKELKEYFLNDFKEYNSVFCNFETILSDNLVSIESHIDDYFKTNKFDETIKKEDIYDYLKSVNKEVFFNDLELDLNDTDSFIEIKIKLHNMEEVLKFHKNKKVI